MSSSKRLLEEMQEKRSNSHLAKRLGISYEELCECEWEINENASDEGLIYSYIIQFDKNSSQEVLDKIGVDDNRCIELSPPLYEDE